jgi:hypothetical protein
MEELEKARRYMVSDLSDPDSVVLTLKSLIKTLDQDEIGYLFSPIFIKKGIIEICINLLSQTYQKVDILVSLSAKS